MREDLPTQLDRRSLLGNAVLSAGAVMALANIATPASAQTRRRASANQGDIDLLNAAISLEHQGIAAYTIAAGSGLLMPEVLALGVKFRGHHQQHRDDLIAAVTRLGGRSPAAKTDAEYAVDIDAASLRSQADILRLALRLERGAANAYLGLIQPLNGEGLEFVVAQLAADEVVHATVLAAALGEAIPDRGNIYGG